MSTTTGGWVKQAVNRICFRGDDRAPTEAFQDNLNKYKSPVISKDGFTSSDEPVYSAAGKKVGDIASGGVCVTTRFSIASLFPLGSNNPHTWIYAVFVREAWNTHAKQVYDAQALLAEEAGGNALIRFLTLGNFGKKNHVPQPRADEIMWALFGDEIVAENIPSADIIGAVKCERILNGKKPVDLFKQGMDYKLHPPIVMNPGCRVPLAIYQATLGFLNDELNLHGTGRTPAVQTGFARSDPKSPHV